ncbi:MAG: hypothetical protein K6E29_01275, partial [Cyanobacteria bacterium RUI128]|nr:hypothetical protein [Cyanobacteria bacterium RUI128]
MLSAVSNISLSKVQPKEQKKTMFLGTVGGAKPDAFERGEDKSNNGKFDWSEAGKNFLKGVISPVTAIFKHPLATAGIIGATVLACSLVPVLAPITAIGFGALSLYQLGKGCV